MTHGRDHLIVFGFQLNSLNREDAKAKNGSLSGWVMASVLTRLIVKMFEEFILYLCFIDLR